MKAAIYLRVSTSDQHADNQLLELQRFAVDKGWTVATVLVDHESGRKGRAERKGLDQVFKLAHQKKIDVVLVWALDRFTREGVAATIRYIERLDGYGVAIYSYTEEFVSTLDPVMRPVLISFMAALAKLESDRISQRTKAGLARVKAQGKKLGRPRKIDRVRRPVLDALAQLNLDGEPPTTKEVVARVYGVTGITIGEGLVYQIKREEKAHREASQQSA